jgi:hypothetical protein
MRCRLSLHLSPSRAQERKSRPGALLHRSIHPSIHPSQAVVSRIHHREPHQRARASPVADLSHSAVSGIGILFTLTSRRHHTNAASPVWRSPTPQRRHMRYDMCRPCSSRWTDEPHASLSALPCPACPARPAPSTAAAPNRATGQPPPLPSVRSLMLPARFPCV